VLKSNDSRSSRIKKNWKLRNHPSNNSNCCDIFLVARKYRFCWSFDFSEASTWRPHNLCLYVLQSAQLLRARYPQWILDNLNWVELQNRLGD
jgi:hypothetical protein